MSVHKVKLVVDIDGDGDDNVVDNCPFVINPGGPNSDGDSHGDACDNCPFVDNEDQLNADGDAFGDACETGDIDNDGIDDADDNCPSVANPGQEANDNDSLGDACDPDDDNDGILDVQDNCSFHRNGPFETPNYQFDSDNDGFGNRCDADLDNSGFVDIVDFNIYIELEGRPMNYVGPSGIQAIVADLNGDGQVRQPDGNIFIELYGLPVGPSGYEAACSNPATTPCNPIDAMSPNVVPDAVPTSDPAVGASITFRGGLSSDPDGALGYRQFSAYPYSIISYIWDFDDGANGGGLTIFQKNPTHTYTSFGTKDVTLRVFDNAGAFSTTTIQVFVDEDSVESGVDNCPGVTNPGQEDYDNDSLGDACDPDIDNDGILNEQDNCTHYRNGPNERPNYQLDSDADGYGNPCDADLDNSGFVDLVDFNIYIELEGRPMNYVGPSGIQAVVADLNGDGQVRQPDGNIFISLFDQPPGPSGYAAACGGAIPCTPIVAGSPNTDPVSAPAADFISDPPTVQFRGNFSTDPDGALGYRIFSGYPNSIITHIWNFDDGANSGGLSVFAENPNHVYTSFGDKTVTLTVFDNTGASDTATFDIFIPRCGDGINSPGEECDSSDLVNPFGSGISTCDDVGAMPPGTLGCHLPGPANECTYDVSQCFQATGMISATPNPCTILLGESLCATYLSATTNASSAEETVCVFIQSSQAIYWCGWGSWASLVPDWVSQAGVVFELRAGTDYSAPLLDSLFVNGVPE